MIGTNPAFDEFITAHRWATLTTLRRNGSPVTAVIAYAREGDELVVSTTRDRFRVTCIRRDPKVNLCVISNSEPFNFVAIEGTASIQETGVLAPTRAVFQAIRDTGYREPADLPAWIEQQGRLIIRIHPDRVSGVIR
jgi:PPOX class probable F420-dependent enzyme